MCLLQVSNDQLRDHVWNLLRPKHMLKWTQRHIIRYYFNFAKTEAFLQYPLPYTPCVQHFVEQAVWLLPLAQQQGGSEAVEAAQKQPHKWLCIRAV